MGTLVGHVAPGIAFFALGLWHLFNHIKLHVLHPYSYRSHPWFPTRKIKYLELFLIMLGSSISMAMELFIGPVKHQPFDPDGTIPSNHLHNIEHATISLTFFTYALFSIILDRIGTKAQYGLTNLVAAIAFAQQLFLFHLHSAYHKGIEGQYHLLQQIIVVVSLTTTLIAIFHSKSFMVSFARSGSILFQGGWFIIMGFVIWTPQLTPKGCFINYEEGHHVVRCHGEEDLHRAKSLVNLQFSLFLVGFIIFLVSLYLGLEKLYGEMGNGYYSSLKESFEDEEYDDNIESQKEKISNSIFIDHMKSVFLPSNDMKM